MKDPASKPSYMNTEKHKARMKLRTLEQKQASATAKLARINKAGNVTKGSNKGYTDTNPFAGSLIGNQVSGKNPDGTPKA